MIRPPRKGTSFSNLELIKALIDLKLCDVHTSIPGRVEAFDAENHTADIQPLLKRPTFDEWQNRCEPESYPLLADVPVRYPCGGGYTITFPLAAGDMGMIEICEASLEEVSISGEESEPFDLRRHHLSHATFVPNFWDRTDLVPIVASALVIGKRDSGQQLRIGDSSVEACNASTGSADDFVAMATKVKTVLDAIMSAFDSWTPVAMDGGAALKVAWTAAMLGPPPITTDVASTNLKAD